MLPEGFPSGCNPFFSEDFGVTFFDDRDRVTELISRRVSPLLHRQNAPDTAASPVQFEGVLVDIDPGLIGDRRNSRRTPSVVSAGG